MFVKIVWNCISYSVNVSARGLNGQNVLLQSRLRSERQYIMFHMNNITNGMNVRMPGCVSGINYLFKSDINLLAPELFFKF